MTTEEFLKRTYALCVTQNVSDIISSIDGGCYKDSSQYNIKKHYGSKPDNEKERFKEILKLAAKKSFAECIKIIDAEDTRDVSSSLCLRDENSDNLINRNMIIIYNRLFNDGRGE